VSDPPYGLDISGTTDIDPLLLDATGLELMRQVCIARLFCRPGSCLSAPTDTTIDVRDFLNGSIDLSKKSGVTQVAVLCQNALLGDERIFSVTVTPIYILLTKSISLAIQGTGANGPFSLTLAIDQVTVQLIRQV